MQHRFFQLLTAPFGGLKDRTILEWTFSQTPVGDATGPFPAPHLAAIGIRVAGMGSGFIRGVPPDRIVYEYDSRLPLRDFESAGSNWLISSSALRALERFAANAIDVAPADVFVSRDGAERAATGRLLCDVIRFEDAVDEGASKIQWKGARYGMGSVFQFRSDLPKDLHLFRVKKAPHVVACSQQLRDVLRQANLSGLTFEEL